MDKPINDEIIMLSIELSIIIQILAIEMPIVFLYKPLISSFESFPLGHVLMYGYHLAANKPFRKLLDILTMIGSNTYKTKLKKEPLKSTSPNN